MLLRRRLSLVTMYIRIIPTIYPRKNKYVYAYCTIDCAGNAREKYNRQRYLMTRENKYKFRGASIPHVRATEAILCTRSSSIE